MLGNRPLVDAAVIDVNVGVAVVADGNHDGSLSRCTTSHAIDKNRLPQDTTIAQ